VSDGTLYGLAFSISDPTASALRAAPRDWQSGQHSRGQDGGDEFAILHFLSLSQLNHRINAALIRSVAEQGLAATG